LVGDVGGDLGSRWWWLWVRRTVGPRVTQPDNNVIAVSARTFLPKLIL
jgi:hypothetical protein